MIYDAWADDDMQVGILKEVGFDDRVKLYIHHKGETQIRICKLRPEQITIDEDILPFLSLG